MRKRSPVKKIQRNKNTGSVVLAPDNDDAGLHTYSVMEFQGNNNDNHYIIIIEVNLLYCCRFVTIALCFIKDMGIIK